VAPIFNFVSYFAMLLGFLVKVIKK